MCTRKSFINKGVKLGVNKIEVSINIKSIKDIETLEYSCKKTLGDIKKLNSSKYKLEPVDYEYFYKSMCKFAISLDKMDILKISQYHQNSFISSFEKFDKEFREIEDVNLVRSSNMD